MDRLSLARAVKMPYCPVLDAGFGSEGWGFESLGAHGLSSGARLRIVQAFTRLRED